MIIHSHTKNQVNISKHSEKKVVTTVLFLNYGHGKNYMSRPLSGRDIIKCYRCLRRSIGIKITNICNKTRAFTKLLQDNTCLLWISVEVKIHHHIPWVVTTDCSSKSQYFTCQQPPHQTNRMGTLQYTKDCTY